MSPERAARRLAELLRAERDAAAGGDLARLAALAPEKARLAERVEAGLAAGASLDPAPLRALAEALREGEPLLRAALDGVRAARAGVEAGRAAREAPLRTYGPDGAAQAIARGPSGPVRRA